MRSLLDALQAGRLIELTDSHKTKALEYLAALIEAIPDIGVEGGITENVLAREQRAQYRHRERLGMSARARSARWRTGLFGGLESRGHRLRCA